MVSRYGGISPVNEQGKEGNDMAKTMAQLRKDNEVLRGIVLTMGSTMVQGVNELEAAGRLMPALALKLTLKDQLAQYGQVMSVGR